ncbi:ATP-dependent RNA helicase rok1 [Striga asiatica]|uniref:ATP-dependent RNA helicase rok1 n=1 Tax=Striga asiatica TaxID=4170 RepID=A0A5A7QVF4_STRAF|nr:ATP-dependent RNA helicase rok1 [Striga asiatica]
MAANILLHSFNLPTLIKDFRTALKLASVSTFPLALKTPTTFRNKSMSSSLLTTIFFKRKVQSLAKGLFPPFLALTLQYPIKYPPGCIRIGIGILQEAQYQIMSNNNRKCPPTEYLHRREALTTQRRAQGTTRNVDERQKVSASLEVRVGGEMRKRRSGCGPDLRGAATECGSAMEHGEKGDRLKRRTKFVNTEKTPDVPTKNEKEKRPQIALSGTRPPKTHNTDPGQGQNPWSMGFLVRRANSHPTRPVEYISFSRCPFSRHRSPASAFAATTLHPAVIPEPVVDPPATTTTSSSQSDGYYPRSICCKVVPNLLSAALQPPYGV